MRKGSIGYMEKFVETEMLARIIYLRTHECVVPEKSSSNYMEKSQHPTERACYNAACEIIDRYLK